MNRRGFLATMIAIPAALKALVVAKPMSKAAFLTEVGATWHSVPEGNTFTGLEWDEHVERIAREPLEAHAKLHRYSSRWMLDA